MARLSIVVPLVVLLIFLLLFTSFSSLRNAVLIVLNIPFALTRRRRCTVHLGTRPRCRSVGRVHRPVRRGGLKWCCDGVLLQSTEAGRATP
ncbi:MAG: hypothetical protein IPL06_19935 [Betaproteobacteria bacterium]|nr:hypothetical protein [Betaproteobacteria bacterium]